MKIMRFTVKKYPALFPGSDLSIDNKLLKNGRQIQPDKKRNELIPILRIIRDSYLPQARKFPKSYVSDVFFSDALNSVGKIWEENVGKILGRPYFFLMKDGNCRFGVAGLWHCIMAEHMIGYFWHKPPDQNPVIYSSPENFKRIKGDEKFNDKDLTSMELHIGDLAILLFKEFAELKAKTLPAKGKIKEFHCRYKSDLPFKIELLTENWYTESVQSHPFVVRGHWRHQRYGQGLEKTKLIYIDPFMKTGYKKGAYMNK